MSARSRRVRPGRAPRSVATTPPLFSCRRVSSSRGASASSTRARVIGSASPSSGSASIAAEGHQVGLDVLRRLEQAFGGRHFSSRGVGGRHRISLPGQSTRARPEPWTSIGEDACPAEMDALGGVRSRHRASSEPLGPGRVRGPLGMSHAVLSIGDEGGGSMYQLLVDQNRAKRELLLSMSPGTGACHGPEVDPGRASPTTPWPCCECWPSGGCRSATSRIATSRRSWPWSGETRSRPRAFSVSIGRRSTAGRNAGPADRPPGAAFALIGRLRAPSH